MTMIDRVKSVIVMRTGASSVFVELVQHLAWPGENLPISVNRAVATLDNENLELYFDCLRSVRMGEDFTELAESLRREY